MLIRLQVKPNSKKSGVEFSNQAGESGGSLVVRVKASPVEGKANKEVIERLAEFFDIHKSAIEIVGGLTSKNKKVAIPDAAAMKFTTATKA